MQPIGLARTNGIVAPNQSYYLANERIIRWGTDGLAVNGDLGIQMLPATR
jgi:hypothetical protein